MGGVGIQLEQKRESKKGGATLIRPSSINFTAVSSSLSKGMEIRFYSLKIRKMEKKYEKDDNVLVFCFGYIFTLLL